MKEREFRQWLEDTGKGPKTINSRISNLSKIEQFYGDLDILMVKDLGRSVIDELNYTIDDEFYNRSQRHKIPIDGNIRNGSATYKSALVLYQKFYKETNREQKIYSSDFEKEADNITDIINKFNHKLIRKSSLNRSEIKELQSCFCKYLSENIPHIKWDDEVVYHKTIKDRIDILGTKRDDYYVIIELDPPRADSVSKKFVSRNYLFMDSNVIYITLCYPNNRHSINECKKYFMYCDIIMRNLGNTNFEKYYKGIILKK